MHSRSQWVRRWQQWHWHPSVVLCLDNNLQLALQELQTLDNGEELRGIFKILNKNKRLAKQSVRAQPVPSWNSTVQTLHQLFLLLRKSSLLPPRPAVDLQCCWPRLPWGWLCFLCPCHLRLHMRAFPMSTIRCFPEGTSPLPGQVPPTLSLQPAWAARCCPFCSSASCTKPCVTAASGISLILIHKFYYTRGKLCFLLERCLLGPLTLILLYGKIKFKFKTCC